MSRSKSSVVKKSIKNPVLMGMFNKMVGASAPDPEIVIPKYKKIHEDATAIVSLLENFEKSIIGETFKPVFPAGFDQLRKFIDKSKKKLAKLEIDKNHGVMSCEEIKEINGDPDKILTYMLGLECKYQIGDLAEKYKAIKESYVIQEIIMIAKNIKTALMLEKDRAKTTTHDLEDKKKLSDNFIINSDGDYLPLFNFTNLDFKQLWLLEDFNSDHKKYMLYLLHLIYFRSMNLVKIRTSPDIDVERFSELLVDHISGIRAKYPDCKDAFIAIEKSVDLLKNNFDSYYKDFVISNNPSIIIEDFIGDVAQKHHGDMKLMSQFKKIVSHFGKSMKAKGVQDKGLQTLMDLANENMNILTEEYDNKEKEENISP